MNKEDEILYDGDDSVKFIRNYLPESVNSKFDDDDIYYIVDLIYDYYDSKSFLDGDDNKIVDIDEDEIVAYVLNNTLTDGIDKYEAEDVALVVEGEMEYCESIGGFDWVKIRSIDLEEFPVLLAPMEDVTWMKIFNN